MSLYRNILSRAFRLSWQHKYLLFFGLFVALITDEYSIIARLFRKEDSDYSILSALKSGGLFQGGILGNLGTILREDPFSLMVFLLFVFLILALGIFLVWLMVVSQAAVMANTAAIASEKKHSLKDGVRIGIKNFWPVLGLNVINKILLFFCLFLVSLPLILLDRTEESRLASWLFVSFFIIFVMLALVFSFIVKYAIAFTVLKGKKFFFALKEGYKLFLDNWLVSVEMALIMLALVFLVGFCVLLAVAALTIPFSLILQIASFSAIGFMILFITFYLGILLFIFFFGSFLAVFQTSAWTLLFTELITRGGESKISRLVEDIKEKGVGKIFS